MATKKTRLYLVHAQGRYGENCYVPLSVGVLWAYARTFADVTDAYELADFLYLKEPIDQAVARLEAPDLVGIAHYLWNAEWNRQFARAVKQKWPACQILVGGVQVPDDSPRILQENPQFDFAIYGEGEGAFVEFLRAHRNLGDYGHVGSLIWRLVGGVVVNPRRAFMDLAELRSPYLDGVFDSLWPREPRWQVLQEFDRGCPYGCTFCAWGQAAMNDLRLFPEERIRRELEWFGQHKVDYLDQADANFGIVKRDVELARALTEVKRRYGYPRTFRTSFAKNSNETIWTIATLLHEAQMLKAVTLAMQSMDEHVLVQIKRKNIKYDRFSDWIKRYEEAGIPTYTELILGLPGETYEMFVDGIERNLEAGQHSGLFVYVNVMLENSEQHQEGYIKAHGLVTRPMLAMLSHGTPDGRIPREVQDIVVETAALPHDQWKQAWLYSKVIEVFHSQGGLLRDLALYCHGLGVAYRDFYERFLSWCHAHPDTVAGRQVAGLVSLLDRVLSGGLWDLVDPRLGEISWPPEEFAFAKICLELERFYDELEPFRQGLDIPDLEWKAQRRALSGPTPGQEAEWARDVVWYGRRGTGAKKVRRAS